MNSPPQQPDRLHQWLRWLDVDRAVAYAVLARCWQLPAGLVSTLLIATYFSEDTQGYYYTLIPLIGLQTLADSGLQGLILHFASHERTGFQVGQRGELTGDREALERLASIYRFGLRWFTAASLLFGVAVVGTGWYLLTRAGANVPWHLPLLLTVVLASFSLAWSPLIAILEGCNEVRVINRTRLLQAVTGSAVAWACIASGAGLWTLVATAIVQVLWEGYVLFVRYRGTWLSLHSISDSKTGGEARIDWRVEIWPLQWRLLAQVASRHFAYTPLIPLVLEHHGASVAGQLGMTWAVLTNLQLAAFSWVRTRSPRFGILISQRNFSTLDREFLTTVGVTAAAILTLAASFVAMLYALSQSQFDWAVNLSNRFLPWQSATCYALILLPSHFVQAFGLYLRAHKKEPTLVVTCLGNAALGSAVIYLCTFGGVPQAGLGMFAVLALFTLPGVTYVWQRSRREWHQDLRMK